MRNLFISYSRADVEFARRLAAALKEPGTEIWLDVEDIPPGMKWSSAIQEGLDSAQVMLVIVSPESMASPNVEDEWQYALDRGVPVIPVLWKPADVHFQLNRLQYIDFYEHDFDDALPHLQNAIDIKIAAPESSFRVPGKRQVWPTPDAYPQPRWVTYMRYFGYGLFGLIVIGAILYYNVIPGAPSPFNTSAVVRSMKLPGTESVPVYSSPTRRGDPIRLTAPTFTLRVLPGGELWYVVESTDESVKGTAYVPAADVPNDELLYVLPLSVTMSGTGLQFYDAPDVTSPSITELGTTMLVFLQGFWRSETGELWYRASKPSGFQHGWLYSADGTHLPFLAGYVTTVEELTLWTEPASTSTTETLGANSIVRILTATPTYYEVLVFVNNDWQVRYVEREDLSLPDLMQQDLENRTLS